MKIRFPVRQKNSHKGQNGSVCVIGGNEIFHGAPILAALGAEKSGVDLIYLVLPPLHLTAAKVAAPNFIISPFTKGHLRRSDLKTIREYSEKSAVTVIGNGIGKEPETQKAVLEFLAKSNRPLVIDGEALIPEILSIPHQFPWILTPHEGEFQRLFGVAGNEHHIKTMAKKYEVTLLKKGPVDFIADPSGSFTANRTGNSRMTVGGSGDALAGIVGGFLAQGLTAFQACETAAYLWGKCGEVLAQELFSFSARDLLEAFPKIVRKLKRL